jgi:hypothetical protein
MKTVIVKRARLTALPDRRGALRLDRLLRLPRFVGAMRSMVSGAKNYETTRLTGQEGFNAQGLEGKVRVRKPLFNALMNMDLLPRNRARILTTFGA